MLNLYPEEGNKHLWTELCNDSEDYWEKRDEVNPELENIEVNLKTKWVELVQQEVMMYVTKAEEAQIKSLKHITIGLTK